MSIAPIGAPTGGPPDIDPRAGGNSDEGFAASLERMSAAVEGSSREANDAITRMLDGSGDVHDAMIALQRADLTLQLTVQVKNKLVNAYHEIMRMPV